MAIPRKSCRSLQDISTHSGSVEQKNRPDRAFMRIACLEMEKLRREKERESAMQRVRNIDARLREIEVEKTSLLETLREQGDSILAPRTPGIEEKVTSRGNTGGIKLRY